MSLHRELRGELIAAGYDHKEYAKALDRSTGYVSARMNAKAPWDMDDVYATLDLLGKTPEDIPRLFPKKGMYYEPKAAAGPRVLRFSTRGVSANAR